MKKFILVLVVFLCLSCDNNDEQIEYVATLYGTITDFTTGDLVSTATVELYIAGIGSLGDLLRTTVTGTDGIYRFPNIHLTPYSTSHHYNIRVLHPNYQEYVKRIDVYPGLESELNLSIEPK